MKDKQEKTREMLHLFNLERENFAVPMFYPIDIFTVGDVESRLGFKKPQRTFYQRGGELRWYPDSVHGENRVSLRKRSQLSTIKGSADNETQVIHMMRGTRGTR